MSALSFKVLKKDNKTGARIGELKLTHGSLKTPVFMPVGTKGDVKCLMNEEVLKVSEGLILANTYHLYLQPGEKLLKSLGGLRNFTKWSGCYLTDSGGYQVFSLSKTRKITEEGVFFRHYKNGSLLFMSPEDSIHMQNAIGSDIMMSFDECPPFDSTYQYMENSVNRTIRWAKRGKEANLNPDTQALFGINQGGGYKDLRLKSLKALEEIGFDGYSIGGLAVGESQDKRIEVLEYLKTILPESKPRYLMGVGTPDDILYGVINGVDMFDCVEPTRIARHGVAFTRYGKIIIKNKEFEEDMKPLDSLCDCEICKTYSRSYIRHLFREGEELSHRMLTFHNLYFLKKMMEEIRNAIENDSLLEYKDEFLRKYLTKKKTTELEDK